VPFVVSGSCTKDTKGNHWRSRNWSPKKNLFRS